MAESTRGAVALRPASVLVGRASELQDIERALERGQVVTLVGPPGAGKTRLAWEVATSRPGAVVCELATAHSEPEVVAQLAHASGFRTESRWSTSSTIWSEPR